MNFFSNFCFPWYKVPQSEKKTPLCNAHYILHKSVSGAEEKKDNQNCVYCEEMGTIQKLQSSLKSIETKITDLDKQGQQIVESGDINKNKQKLLLIDNQIKFLTQKKTQLETVIQKVEETKLARDVKTATSITVSNMQFLNSQMKTDTAVIEQLDIEGMSNDTNVYHQMIKNNSSEINQEDDNNNEDFEKMLKDNGWAPEFPNVPKEEEEKSKEKLQNVKRKEEEKVNILLKLN